ncbi:MAG: radical SAM protein [Candidatus Omnitrophica bacterium]|nr:radical SAM protein [Candidatus Omnitrophota bacterium]
MNSSALRVPARYNYIACFLTLSCNLRCSYCINYFGGGNASRRKLIPGRDWVRGLNRIVCAPDMPVTLQGGEPSLHPDFIWIINHLKKDLHIDILTNLRFDVDAFIGKVDPARLRRKAPYASIRVSYHPTYMDLKALAAKVIKMQNAGFSIGVFGILHPAFKQRVLKAQRECRGLGIDFRTKEFLGEYKGRTYGTYLSPQAISSVKRQRCLCRTSELIVGPDGNVFRCHYDLYHGLPPIGCLLDNSFKIRNVFRKCDYFGACNPCDVKVKTNRFQVFGHSSVEIKKIQEVSESA